MERTVARPQSRSDRSKEETPKAPIGIWIPVTQPNATTTKYMKAVSKFRGLAAVRRCYAEGGGDCYAKL
jgi:hypothetical protein